jgi:hypothetical protein
MLPMLFGTTLIYLDQQTEKLSPCGDKSYCFPSFCIPAYNISYMRVFSILFIDKPGKVVAQGASGTIKIIIHIASGRKLVRKQVALIEGEEERIKEEASVIKGIHSPYVVEILDSFCDENYQYLVMEYYESGTLATIVEELIKSKKQIDESVFILRSFVSIKDTFFLLFC